MVTLVLLSQIATNAELFDPAVRTPKVQKQADETERTWLQVLNYL
jgi:hypothetical protein